MSIIKWFICNSSFVNNYFWPLNMFLWSRCLVHFVIDLGKSSLAPQLLSHLIIETMIKHVPELLPRHVRVRVHHLETSHLTNKFFNLPRGLNHFKPTIWIKIPMKLICLILFAFGDTVNTNINEHFFFATLHFQHSSVGEQFEGTEPDWINLHFRVEEFNGWLKISYRHQHILSKQCFINCLNNLILPESYV